VPSSIPLSSVVEESLSFNFVAESASSWDIIRTTLSANPCTNSSTVWTTIPLKAPSKAVSIESLLFPTNTAHLANVRGNRVQTIKLKTYQSKEEEKKILSLKKRNQK